MKKAETISMFGQQFKRDIIKGHYLANANGLKRMLDKAVVTGKKVNGYTAEQLTERVKFYNDLANSL